MCLSRIETWIRSILEKSIWIVIQRMGKKNQGRFFLLPTWNEPRGSSSFAHLFEKGARQREVVSHAWTMWKCENCTHLYTKNVSHANNRVSIRTRKSNWLLSWKHAFTSSVYPESYAFNITASSPFFSNAAAEHIQKNRERKGKRTYFGNEIFKKKSCVVSLKILDSMSSSISAGPIV